MLIYLLIIPGAVVAAGAFLRWSVIPSRMAYGLGKKAAIRSQR